MQIRLIWKREMIKMNKLIFLAAIIPILMLTVPNAYASDRNCEQEPNDELCTGEKGAQGMNFCTDDRFGDCYDRDFSRIDCDEIPGHSRCTGFQGRDGLIFCDVQYQDVGFKSNCYDRNDNPREYCDEYAIDESDRWYKAEFCQSICDNYQEVIGRGEPCSN